MRTLLVASTALMLLLQTGCGLLIGNVKPIEEKSDSYGVMDLSKENADWVKLSAASADQNSKEPQTTESEVSDVAFQSKKNYSIISINSACRPSNQTSGEDLRTFTNSLLLGISDITRRDEESLQLQRTNALQTTVEGKMNGESMMLRTVVLRRGPCVYDLMYVARPQHFAENEVDFSHFIASLRLK